MWNCLEQSGKNLFWSFKNSSKMLDQLIPRYYRASKLFTYDFSTPNTMLPHKVIIDKLCYFIERTLIKESFFYLACTEKKKKSFYRLNNIKMTSQWIYQNVCDTLIFLLDSIYIRYETKLYTQNVSIPIGMSCWRIFILLWERLPVVCSRC